jgi:hypothetical protein
VAAGRNRGQVRPRQVRALRPRGRARR